jgi:transcriptional regulator GlxA family with amidase domain
MSLPVVAVVAFDRISPFHLSVPCVVFGEAHFATPEFEVRVCAAETTHLATTAGFGLAVDFGFEAIDAADIVVVPSWRDAHERPPETLLDRLVAAHGRGAQVVGLCLGAFVLAHAGLLDGRRATTHWAFVTEFAHQFPHLTLEPDVLYVDEGDVLTSAGTAAGLDCCLHLVRQRCGVEVANRVARRLVVAPHRAGGQSQFIEQPLPQIDECRLGFLLDTVRADLTTPHTLDSLAAQAGQSRRTFSRHFRRHTGTTVTQWLLSERLALAQQLLQSTSAPVDAVAAQAGFGSPESLRLHFRRQVGLSPSAWRHAFGGRPGDARSAQIIRPVLEDGSHYLLQ